MSRAESWAMSWSGRWAVLGALAGDVLRRASRGGLLWVYLVLGTAVSLLVVSQADVRGEQIHPAPALLRGDVPLPAPGRPLPGTLQVATVERVLLRDDGQGRLVDGAGAPAGALDAGQALLRLSGEVAPAGTATISWGVDLSTRARRTEAGAPTRMVAVILGAQSPPYDNRHRPANLAASAEHVAGELTRAGLYQMLVAIVAAMAGQVLGVLAMAGAVPQAFRPGTAPLLLPRPVGRGGVILGRFAGALLFAALQLGWMLAVATLATWVRLELLPWQLLLAGAAQLLKFALLLAAAALGALVSRSVIVGLLGAAGLWAVSTALDWLAAGAELGPLGSALRLDVALGWLGLLWPPIAAQDRVSAALCGLSELGSVVGIALRGVGWTLVLLTLCWLAVRRRDC